MTNKAQTMLTIALTFAVSVLLVDRIIEPAQAQECVTPMDLAVAVDAIVHEITYRSPVGECATSDDVESAVMLWCK